MMQGWQVLGVLNCIGHTWGLWMVRNVGCMDKEGGGKRGKGEGGE